MYNLIKAEPDRDLGKHTVSRTFLVMYIKVFAE